MRNKIPICLAIETSCDETSAAVTQGRIVLSNVISTQIDLHKQYGGVVPEIASRHHIESISVVIQQALDEAKVDFKNIDIIATTYGPGLVGALLVGLSAAKGIAFALNKPLIGVHHIAGHIAANYIQNEWLVPPFVCLVVSGGHTQIVHVKDYADFEVLAKTRDDAAGEAFDKIARAIGLGYPGGPLIEKASQNGNKQAYDFPKVHFNDSFDFSFSGIKTAVINQVNKLKMQGQEICIPDISASFQEAVTEILVENTIKIAQKLKIDKVAIAGGVAANSCLRQKLQDATAKHDIRLSYPEKILCTDNAAMIGCAAYYNYLSGKTSQLDLNAVPSMEL
jgi:N6-L-threonylcarbamoyladenine synthase